jgi:hypothetical protein
MNAVMSSVLFISIHFSIHYGYSFTFYSLRLFIQEFQNECIHFAILFIQEIVNECESIHQDEYIYSFLLFIQAPMNTFIPLF